MTSSQCQWLRYVERVIRFDLIKDNSCYDSSQKVYEVDRIQILKQFKVIWRFSTLKGNGVTI